MSTIWDDNSDYPMGTNRVPVRQTVLRGRWSGYRRRRQRAEAVEVPVLITPPVQTDEERGQGDSTNARLHKLLRGDR